MAIRSRCSSRRLHRRVALMQAHWKQGFNMFQRDAPSGFEIRGAKRDARFTWLNILRTVYSRRQTYSTSSDVMPCFYPQSRICRNALKLTPRFSPLDVKSIQARFFFFRHVRVWKRQIGAETEGSATWPKRLPNASRARVVYIWCRTPVMHSGVSGEGFAGMCRHCSLFAWPVFKNLKFKGSIDAAVIIDRRSTICDDWSHKFIRKTRETPQIATTGVDVSHFVLEMILILIIIMSFHGGSICFRELSQGKLLQTLSQSHRH